MPIVLGNCDRCNIVPDSITFEDSLPMLRRKLNLPSYSQPNVYKSCFNKGYKAHHAYEDAKALYQVLEHVAEGNILDLFNTKKLPIKIKKTSDLRQIKGVGPKSVIIFNANGIYNRSQLDKWIASHTIEQFKGRFNRVYAYKKLAERLFNTAII